MHTLMKSIENFLSSRRARVAAGIIGALFLALLIFHAGVVFGARRAEFGGPFGRAGMERGFRPSFFPGGFEFPRGFISGTHGAVGTVTALALPTFTLQTREGTSQTILVSTSTLFRNMGTATNTEELSVGSSVIVLGEPDSQGRIDAKLIRILPSSPLP